MEHKLDNLKKQDPPEHVIIPSVQQAPLLVCSKKINTVANIDISKLSQEEQAVLLEKALVKEQFESLLGICERVLDDALGTEDN